MTSVALAGREYSIAPARERHLEAIAGIELAAAALLVGHAPLSVLRETTDMAALADAAQHGRLWVALNDDLPVGFAHVEMLAAHLPHLEELDVHPSHGRRGLGTALVRTACAWAAAASYRQLTLTTFRAVPWNMPFYARLGFVELPREEWPAELAAVVADEAARGLAADTRVVMARACRR
jgi:GNAT superfamily N-acetyltransferase